MKDFRMICKGISIGALLWWLIGVVLLRNNEAALTFLTTLSIVFFVGGWFASAVGRKE